MIDVRDEKGKTLELICRYQTIFITSLAGKKVTNGRLEYFQLSQNMSVLILAERNIILGLENYP